MAYMITTILFDYYGIFQKDPFEIWLKSHHLERTGKYSALSKEQDSGHIGRHEFIDALSKLSGYPTDYNDFYAQAILNKDMVQLAQRLSRRYKLGLLSNSSSSLRTTLDTLGILSIFDEIIISGEVGVTKPDPAIYTLALQKLSGLAEATIFIDDNRYNLLPAAKLGMQTIHFTSERSLAESLHAKSILTK